jgi:signal transduction histidine kinase
LTILQKALNEERKKTSSLQEELKNTKVFLNMVIHDLRNPTNQIKFAIDLALTSIKEATIKTDKLESYWMKLMDQYEDAMHSVFVDLVNEFSCCEN